MSGEKRYANTPQDLIFFTDMDDDDYPIYIKSDREIWLKKKPNDVLAVFHVKVKGGGLYYLPNSEKDFVESVKDKVETNEEMNKVLEIAAKAITELGNNAEKSFKVYDLTYEVYAGDHERFIGTANANAVKIYATSNFRCWEKQAWAISFEWEKRIKAKYPDIVKYIYAKAIIGKRNYARVIVKIPFPTKEFEEIFSRVLATAAVTQVSVTSELEEQIKKLEELIKLKESELQTLKEQLQQLQLKLQLEQMKRAVV